MFVTFDEKIPIVRFMGGSSTLVLGNADIALNYFWCIADYLRSTENIGWLCPQVTTFSNQQNIYEVGTDEWMKNTEKFLEPPREILYQALGQMICIGGKLLFLSGVTGELVEKYDNQNLTPAPRVNKAKTNSDSFFENEYESEYAPEYPEFDEFGDPTQISWLREYAIRAEDFSRSQEADLFLNLEWNKPISELPTPFWLVFDRIYEIEHNKNGEVNIIKTR
jgi:hypothetical protein